VAVAIALRRDVGLRGYRHAVEYNWSSGRGAAWTVGRPRPIRLVVVASVSDLQDKSHVLLNVWLRSWPALQLLRYLLALIRRRGEESTQRGLRRRRSREPRGSGRILRTQRRHHLRVITCGVYDRTQIGICGRNSRPDGQRQCQTTNCGSQSGQGQPDHFLRPSTNAADARRRRRQLSASMPSNERSLLRQKPQHGGPRAVAESDCLPAVCCRRHDHAHHRVSRKQADVPRNVVSMFGRQTN